MFTKPEVTHDDTEAYEVVLDIISAQWEWADLRGIQASEAECLTEAQRWTLDNYLPTEPEELAVWGENSPVDKYLRSKGILAAVA